MKTIEKIAIKAEAEDKKISVKNLWRAYSSTKEWNNVNKSHENIFRIGVESVMLRGAELLNQFFNHRSDANKYLMAEEQEDLMKEFGVWCMGLCYPSDEGWIFVGDELPDPGQIVECKWNPEGDNYKTDITKEVLRREDNMMLYGVTHWRRI